MIDKEKYTKLYKISKLSSEYIEFNTNKVG